MADTTLPAFAQRLSGVGDDDRKSALAAEHPSYTEHLLSWQVFIDAFEAQGGFLDGTYLWAYPREEGGSYQLRMTQARYHNYLETLIDLYVRFMFTQGVKRESKSQEYNDWLTDVDGAGTTIDEFLKKLAALALACGHSGALVDKEPTAPAGPTRAEDTGRVIASLFLATAIPDWRFKSNTLDSIKLVEDAPSPPIDQPMPTGAEAKQFLVIDTEGWARFSGDGKLLGGDVTNLGMVPFAILRPKPSLLSLMLGRPLVSNANVIRCMFNRCSEEDQVLRDQAFSVFTAEADKDADVEQIKASLGTVVGTAKAIVAKAKMDYKTPSMDVPPTIRGNIEYLVTELYRAAHVRFRRDSLDAESGEAIRLQYTELNEMLQGFAKALEQCEDAIARAWFAWTTATPEAAQAAYDAAAPSADYPDEFFLDALAVDLKDWADAIDMDLGLTMAHRLKKRAVRRIEPDIPPDELKVIDAEIDAQTEATPLPRATDFGGNPLDGGAGAIQ